MFIAGLFNILKKHGQVFISVFQLHRMPNRYWCISFRELLLFFAC